MGVRPPFLFDAEPAPVSVRSEIDTQLTVVGVRGEWDSALWRRSSVTLRKCLAEHPGNLIVDLTGLEDSTGRSVPTWLTAHRQGAAMDPPVRVALCAPAGPGLARRLKPFGRILPVYPQIGKAREALSGRQPLTERIVANLDADPKASGQARRLVVDACASWNLPDLEYSARLVVSELVSNVVEHTGTEPRLLIARRNRGLHLAVADRSPLMLRSGDRMIRRPISAPAEGGRGLQIVHALSAAWGAMPIDGGKVVWALLRS